MGQACVSVHTVARRNVVDDRSLVRVGPRVPCKFNGVTRIGVDVQATCCRALMAVDVRRSHGCGLNEANVLVESVPASSLRTAVGGVVVPDGIRTFGECALDVHASDEAVGGGSVQERSCGAEDEDGGMHCDVALSE